MHVRVHGTTRLVMAECMDILIWAIQLKEHSDLEAHGEVFTFCYLDALLQYAIKEGAEPQISLHATHSSCRLSMWSQELYSALQLV